MNNYLISSFLRIWLTVEKIDETTFKAIFVNKDNEQVMIPQKFKIHNDNYSCFVEENPKQYFILNNTDNHSIYLNENHILDFSHGRLWKVKQY